MKFIIPIYIFAVIIASASAQSMSSAKPSKSSATNKNSLPSANKEAPKIKEVGAGSRKVGNTSATAVPVMDVPAPIPNYTCNNVTGMANFEFAKFATGNWYLWQELSAWPFSHCIGQCVVAKFTPDPANPKSASVIFNTLLDGNFTNSPKSMITVDAAGKGVNAWAISKVNLQAEVLNSVSQLKYIVIATDYTNWAAVHACGALCVYINPTAPAFTSPDCSPGQVTQYQILVRSRTYDQTLLDGHIKKATDALDVMWPYMPYMPVDQTPQMCIN